MQSSWNGTELKITIDEVDKVQAEKENECEEKEYKSDKVQTLDAYSQIANLNGSRFASELSFCVSKTVHCRLLFFMLHAPRLKLCFKNCQPKRILLWTKPNDEKSDRRTDVHDEDARTH